MKNVFAYFKNYKKEIILAPLFKMLEAVIDLFVPLIVARIIDEGIIKGRIDNVLNLFLLMILCAFIGLILSLLGQYFSAKAAVYISADLRRDLFNKLQDLTFYQIDEMGTDTMVTRLTSDINNIQTGINLTLRLLLRSPFVVFGAAIFGTIISPNLALIYWITIIVLSIIVFFIMLYGVGLYKNQQSKIDELVTITKDNLYGIRVIRAFTREEEEIKLFRSKSNNLEKSQNKAANLSNLLNPLTYVIINTAIIILLYLSHNYFNNGSLLEGDIVALYNYMGQILVELIKLANLIITITKALACGKRIGFILNLDSFMNVEEKNKLNDDFIKFDNVSFKYEKSNDYSIKNINFKVQKGQMLGIIGGTGSGKTTILNLLLRYYDINEGLITLKGNKITCYTQEEIYNIIGVALQSAELFTGTIRDNILMGKTGITDEEILEKCRIAQCLDVINSKEGGLDYLVEQKGKNFSGGQKQRICIARALIFKPEIIILDDSTSALDYITDLKFRTALKELNYSPTIIIISQRASSILEADNILVLDDGKQIDFGKHLELLSRCKIYQEIYYSQFEKDGE